MMREAKPEDIAEIKKIEDESYSRPWSEEELLNDMRKELSYFYVYELDGVISGYVIIYKILDEAEIASIAVSKRHRGKGFGRYILKDILEIIKPVKTVYLEVEQTNEPALALYRSFGFNINGNIKNYYGNNRDAYRMSLNLF